jgi:hypothetical protein
MRKNDNKRMAGGLPPRVNSSSVNITSRKPSGSSYSNYSNNNSSLNHSSNHMSNFANGNASTEAPQSSEYARIQVVVRIRPLNDIEISRSTKVILQPDGEQRLVVWDPACFDSITENDIDSIDPACWSRDFAFDRCLWSLDEEDDNYASQDTVFEGM